MQLESQSVRCVGHDVANTERHDGQLDSDRDRQEDLPGADEPVSRSVYYVGRVTTTDHEAWQVDRCRRRETWNHLAELSTFDQQSTANCIHARCAPRTPALSQNLWSLTSVPEGSRTWPNALSYQRRSLPLRSNMEDPVLPSTPQGGAMVVFTSTTGR